MTVSGKQTQEIKTSALTGPVLVATRHISGDQIQSIAAFLAHPTMSDIARHRRETISPKEGYVHILNIRWLRLELAIRACDISFQDLFHFLLGAVIGVDCGTAR